MNFFQRWFSRSSDTVLGLDISAQAVRWVGLRQTGKYTFELQHLQSQPLPEGVFSENQIAQPEAVVQALHSLVQSSCGGASSVAIAIPSRVAIGRKIHVPKGLGQYEIEQYIEIELESALPYPIEEAAWDYYVFGDTPSTNEIEVQWVAAPKSYIQERVTVVEAAGLTPTAVELDVHAVDLALAHILNDSTRPQNQSLFALFEMGKEATRLRCIQGGECIHESEHAFGSDDSRYLSGHVPGYADALVQEITRALQVFMFSASGLTVHHIFLAGDMADLSALRDRLASVTNCPVSVADPFVNLNLGPALTREIVQQQAPLSMYLPAFGLALRQCLK